MHLRPWTTIEDMNEGLIERHNSVIKSDDTIIYLGDLIMGKKSENVPKYIPRLNGHKILLCGNHDWLPSEVREAKLKQFEEMYKLSGIDSIYYGTVDLNDIYKGPTTGIKLCHFPPADFDDPRDIERKEQRYPELRPIIKPDEYLLHGHTHSENKLTTNNILHVGVDAWDYKPVSFEIVLEWLGIK